MGEGIGLLGVIEIRDGTAADVADGPDDAHPGGRGGSCPALGRSGPRLLLFGRVQTQGLGSLGGGPELQTIQGSASHGGSCLVASRLGGSHNARTTVHVILALRPRSVID